MADKSRELNGPQKAAVVVEALGPSAAAAVLNRIPEAHLMKLLEALSRRVDVPADLRAQVLEEFRHHIERGDLYSLGGFDYVRELLTQTFGPELAEEWLRRLQKTQGRQMFSLLAQGRPEDLVTLLQAEHVQVVALVLSHLPAPLSAAVLQQFPPTGRVELVRRMANLETIAPRVVQTIEQQLTERFLAWGVTGQHIPHGLDAAVGVLNKAERATERQILKDLTEVDPPLAERIKARMFLFEDIINLDDRVMEEVLRRVNKKDLALALRLLHPDNQAVFFSHMARAAAEEVRTEMAETGPVPIREAEAAQSRIVAMIRALEEAEEIDLSRSGAEMV